MGFLAKDDEWHDCLKEVSQWASGTKMRRIFVTMVAYSQVSNVKELWEKNWELLSDDIQHYQRSLLNRPELHLSPDETKELCLIELEKLFHKIGKSLVDIPGMPIPNCNTFDRANRLLAEELSYNRSSMSTEFEKNFPKLNHDQRVAYDQIMESINTNNGKCFFIEGFGGSGKTFLWKVISAKLRSEGRIVLCVATSGIAALLMDGGRTAHSRFRIPIKLNPTSTCDIYQGSDVADLHQNASLIIWDEAPMAHRNAIEALERTLRDIMRKHNKNNLTKPFGGMTVVFGGDFRQTLPIIKKGSRADIVDASLKMSYVWQYLEILKLTENLRLRQPNSSETELNDIADFSKWILQIGDGEDCSVFCEANIDIPSELMVERQGEPIIDIVREIYPHLECNYVNPEYLASRAILAPHHEMVHKLNEYVLSQIPGEEITYLSSDYVQNENGKQNIEHPEFPAELLNSLQIPGFPDHEIKLKLGVPVILLRNIDQASGLCNRTRLIIKKNGQMVH
ncbi:unnamed protein product [Linum trigynum]|uniref:ATP-dependent DNA helicase n=1 Tax=Linum trigynum TaxID=586398 RepID=A0AAV2CUB6_9ROSI